MKRKTLLKCKPEAIRRLAKYIGLRINDFMSNNQVINLVVWRLHRNRQWGHRDGAVDWT